MPLSLQNNDWLAGAFPDVMQYTYIVNTTHSKPSHGNLFLPHPQTTQMQ